jgi:small-conductance mechanosensitive channel
MDATWTILTHGLRLWAAPLTVVLVTVAVGIVLQRMLYRAIHRWARRSQTAVDDFLIPAFGAPFIICVLMLGLHLATDFADLPAKAAPWVGKIFLALWIILLTLVAARVAGKIVKYWGSRAQGEVLITSLTENIAKLAVASVGLLFLLNALRISITPMLTAFGVGGLAVALALQDTLSNLFAGIYVSLHGQIRPGDYIRLDTGDEGTVRDINWSSTVVRALDNNLIILPNAKLAKATVTNFSRPDSRLAVSIRIPTAPGTDIDNLERVVLEEVRGAIGQIPGLLAEPEPVVRFNPGFGEFSLEFTLIYHVAKFEDQFFVRHELRRRIVKRFRQEGIEIPFLPRTLLAPRDTK